MSSLPSSQDSLVSMDDTFDCSPGLEKLFRTVLAPILHELEKLRHWQAKLDGLEQVIKILPKLYKQGENVNGLMADCYAYLDPTDDGGTANQVQSLHGMLSSIDSRLKALETRSTNPDRGDPIAFGSLSDEPVVSVNDVRSLREYFTRRMDEAMSRLSALALREDRPELEYHTIKVVISDPVDTIAGMTTEERLDAVRSLSDAFAEVTSVECYNLRRQVTAGATRPKKPFLLLHFKVFETKCSARKQMQKVRDRFRLAHDSIMLPPIYALEIEHGFQRGAAAPNPSAKERLQSLIEGCLPPQLKGVSSFNRFYLETHSLEIAMSLAGKIVELNDGPYKLM
ncbi:unnamed protein product [Fusarium equiseti]|uniref:Uncharacterized protein n=1 Tax=Fusarium equiseti TaxID=61235 RepID=A0A8J2NGB5_FUSEQ|nr:unnamed protein product [Fusarium equiseti]